ncbi:hypothetical protein BXY66_3571 [Shimia isoporae]|uniref:Secreted protein (Por secretion system target) n=1 Tax=Shimia isoporae TaxID=647720 RepID=A0A4R1N1F0_9RHOB|nr:hypothetical protein [Shimia isoporae]TCK99867.1 hypothetical protein BXY66_3571 [Shimia isoporae]
MARRTGHVIALATALAFSFLNGVLAASEPVKQHNSNALWFENWGGMTNATLKVFSPDGTMTELFTNAGTPVYQLPGRDVVDGVYHFELSAATTEQEKVVNQTNNGRGDAARDTVAKSYHTSGSFTVSRGVIVTPEDIKEDDNN